MFMAKAAKKHHRFCVFVVKIGSINTENLYQG